MPSKPTNPTNSNGPTEREAVSDPVSIHEEAMAQVRNLFADALETVRKTGKSVREQIAEGREFLNNPDNVTPNSQFYYREKAQIDALEAYLDFYVKTNVLAGENKWYPSSPTGAHVPAEHADVCDECGEAFPDDAMSIVGDWHLGSCSLHQHSADDDHSDHSHEPQELGDGKYGLHVQDPNEMPEDGDHYYMEITISDNGPVYDVYDKHGENFLGSLHLTYEEVLAQVWQVDAPDDEPCNTCGGTGRHESTTEDSPDELVYLGPCPDCDATDYDMYRFFCDYMIDKEIVARGEDAVAEMMQDIIHQQLQNGYPFSTLNIELVERNV